MKKDKLLDDMAEEITQKVMKKNKDLPYRETQIFTRCILGLMRKAISEWVEDFVKKEIWKMEKGAKK